MISVTDIIDDLQEFLDSGTYKYTSSYFDKEDIEFIIKELEQEPKTGHWIKNELTFWTCDKCGLVNKYNRIKYNYCHNCGAKMESEG